MEQKTNLWNALRNVLGIMLMTLIFMLMCWALAQIFNSNWIPAPVIVVLLVIGVMTTLVMGVLFIAYFVSNKTNKP